MQICPYVFFPGNAAEAIAFYEKAFGVKAQVLTFGDMPAEDGYQLPPGAENLVSHANMNIGNSMLMFSDAGPGMPLAIGDNVAIMVSPETKAEAIALFDALKEGGKVSMDLQQTFWSEAFGVVVDKFGITWQVSIMEKSV